MQASFEDAKATRRAVGVILQSEEEAGRSIPYGVLFTRTSPTIRSRTYQHIYKSVVEAGLTVFKTELNERDAYKGVLLFQQTLDGLDPKDVPNLENAKRNVADFAEELVARILVEQGASGEREEAVTMAVGA